MGMGLRRLLVVTGSLALTQGGTIGVAVAACVLCGYPVSYALRRVFPPS
jgi:ABC-type spermidine/putrescine transport system permease subunit I